MNQTTTSRDVLGASNLLVAAKAALAALSQNATLPADIAAARKWLADAIESSSNGSAKR